MADNCEVMKKIWNCQTCFSTTVEIQTLRNLHLTEMFAAK